MAEISLSELCSICYVEVPKYKCPRCETQTCSLPCYKKHQQRASCSGKRDPAAYVKKTQWATPTGLDRDFNYFKDIERHVEDASKDLEDRGITAGHASLRGVASGWRSDSKLQNYLSEHRITIQRAPKGMQRQRDNTTRSTKSHRALWTVEWISPDGEHEVHHDCPEANSISDLFSVSKLGKRRKAESHQDILRAEKKRKIDPPSITSGSTATSVAQEPADTADASHGPVAESHGNTEEDERTSLTALDPPPIDVQQKSGSEKTLHFYLLKPATTGSAKVVIPLNRKGRLTKCLDGHVVQEYPTVYVLHEDTNELPAGLMLAQDYQAQDHVAAPIAVQSAAPSTGGSVDPESILAMLRRDLTR
ncbi:Box C/D snoRNA accumulation [Recurvomyces mirabilis]|nr:Box C/D snoRNA accumulation [Recurvomyces mirabilis]